MRQVLWVDQLGQDLRYALTLLTRDRAFTLVAALALALGIAATTSLITVVNAVILRGLPLPIRIASWRSPCATDATGRSP